jgi:hypothetical protein
VEDWTDYLNCHEHPYQMKFGRPHIMQIRSTPDTHSDLRRVPELMIAAYSPTARRGSGA